MCGRSPSAICTCFRFRLGPARRAGRSILSGRLRPGWLMSAWQRLRRLATEKSNAHRAQFVGRDLECISLHTPEALAARNLTSALSENFLPLEIEGRFAANQLLTVYATKMNSEGTLQAAMFAAS